MKNMIGKTVEWEKSGRGRGEFERGEIVDYVPPGVSNADALERLKQSRPELLIRKQYLRFNPETHSTHRFFIIVEQETKRARPIYWIYAPNVIEVFEV